MIRRITKQWSTTAAPHDNIKEYLVTLTKNKLKYLVESVLAIAV